MQSLLLDRVLCWGSSYIIAILLLGRVFYSNFQGGSFNGELYWSEYEKLTYLT